MAEALSSSFDNWTRSLLHELRLNDDDINDFVQYLMSVVTSDSETDEEKRETITELFTELDLKHNHNIDNLSQQILDRWYQSQNNYDRASNSLKDPTIMIDDTINDVLIDAMNQMESTFKQQKQYGNHNSNKLNNNTELEKHKSQLLAKYSEISDEELDYGDEHEVDDYDLFQNRNARNVEDREKQIRQLQHEAYKKQQEKNKIDVNNQKQKEEERKTKAQQRAQKQERRR